MDESWKYRIVDEVVIYEGWMTSEHWARLIHRPWYVRVWRWLTNWRRWI